MSGHQPLTSQHERDSGKSLVIFGAKNRLWGFSWLIADPAMATKQAAREDAYLAEGLQSLETEQGQVGDSSDVIWTGTTWDACGCCCGCCMFMAPVCCRSTTWVIAKQRVDMIHGCCGATEDTLDVRRITDIKYSRSCGQLMTGRGTMILYAASDSSTPEVRITHWHSVIKPVFSKLKDVWSNKKPPMVATV